MSIDISKFQDGDPQALGHSAFVLRESTLTRQLDRIVLWIGEIFNWIWVVLLITIVVNVVLRYAFSQGMIELEELQWYLYGIGWIMGMSYTFVYDGHVRVDVVHDGLSYRKKLWLELFGLLILFLPFILFVIYHAVPLVELSWQTNERSTSANGLPARWIVKGFLFFAFVLLLTTGLSRLLKVLMSLRHGAPNGPHASTNEIGA